MSSGVEFDEDKFSFSSKPGASASGNFSGSVPNYSFSGGDPASANQPRMVRFLMRHGLAKSPQSAQIILIILAILNFIITLVVVNVFLF